MGYIEGDGFPSPGNPGSAQRLEDGIEIGSFYGFRYAGVDDAGNILIWEKGEEGGVTKLGADGNEQDKVYLDGTGVPNGSCLGEIRSDIKTLICLCSSVDVFAIK